MQQKAFDETPLNSVIINDQGHVLCSSGNVRVYFSGGKASDNIVQKARASLRKPMCAVLEKSAKTGRTAKSELLSVRIDGQVRQVRLHAQPMTGALKDDRFFQVVFQETGSREELSGAPESADGESHLRRVMDNMPGFVGVLDLDGVLLEANRSALIAGGLAREEVIGKRLFDCYWWNYDPVVMKQVEEAIQRAFSGETVRYDAIVRMAGESRIPIDFMLVPARNGNGIITHLVSSGIDISERKKAEQTMIETGRHLNLALNSGRLGAWKLNLKTGLLEWSDQMYEIYGVKKEEFDQTLSAVLSMIHPDDRELKSQRLAKISQNLSDQYEAEYRVIRPADRQTIWIHSRATVTSDLSDQAMTLSGVVMDITERKRRELAMAFAAELQLTLARLLSADEIMRVAGQKISEFLEFSHCLFVEIDDEAKIADVRYDHFGAGSPSLCGVYQMADFVNREEQERLTAGFSVVINDTGCSTRPAESVARFAALEVGSIIEAACLHNQRLTFLLAGLKPIQYVWRDDEIELMENLATQLHLRIERARAETALAESEKTLRESGQRLSMALRAGGMAAWEWRPESSHWTDELFDLIGIPKHKTPSTELFFEHVHPEDLPGLRKVWQRAVDGLDAYEHEFRIVRPDGDTRWIVGVGQLVRDNNGNVSRIFGMNWDSTRNHLASQALRDSERRAQEANVAKSEFLANMSHEIRTPMTSILGYADLLLANEIDPEKVGQLRTIKRNGSFLLEIINDILDLSKIEADKLDVEKERFAPHKVVRDVLSLMQVRADEKGIKVEVQFDGLIPSRIESDSRRLKQILVNLVGNAIKFTETGSVKLVVRCILGEKSLIQFDVVDTGIGMTRVQQEQLFQPFAQGDNSVSRAYGGTGLGLAISRRLANILGGGIRVESEPEKGSTFSCTIETGDISEEQMIQPNLGAITDSWNEDGSVPKLRGRILVVDDRRDVRMLTRSFLTKAGASVETAEDGQEALDIVVKSIADDSPPVDLILLDMQMPRLDGYQTATALRKMGFQNAIIALTADAMHGDMRRCLECGCNAYLSKPIDGKELVSTVSSHIAKK